MRNPVTEGGKEFARVLIIGLITTVLVQLLAIFALPTETFITSIGSAMTWIIIGQGIGVMVIKDILTALGKGADRTVNVTGTNAGNENMSKGLTRIG